MPSEETVGQRLRALREARRMRAADVAFASGLSASALSKMENDSQRITTHELARLAEALQVSPLAILDGSSLLARLPVAARSSSEDIDGDGYRRVVALAELSDVLAQSGVVATPELGGLPPKSTSWLATANTMAEWARERLNYGTGYEDHVAALADAVETHLRVDVFIEDDSFGNLIGAAITDSEFPLLYVNSSMPSQRSLFTLAHELGHLLFNDADAVSLDRDLSGRNESEKLANAFAAAFLMPDAEVRGSIEELGRGASTIATLMLRFGVSFESLVFRLHNLRIIDAQGRDALRGAGWGGLLRAVDDNEQVSRLLALRETHPERRPPRWLTLRTFEGYREGHVSIRPLAGLLGVDAEDLLAALESHPPQVVNDESIDPFAARYQPPSDDVSDDQLFATSSPW